MVHDYSIVHEPIRHPSRIDMGMALDFRLNALRLAILEDWLELEAYEVEGALVIRLKDDVMVIEPQKERGPRKQE